MDLLLFGFIHTIFSIIYWSVTALIDLIPVAIACIIVATIFTLIIRYIVFH